MKQQRGVSRLVVDGRGSRPVLLHAVAIKVGVAHGQQARHVALSRAALVQRKRHVLHLAACARAHGTSTPQAHTLRPSWHLAATTAGHV